MGTGTTRVLEQDLVDWGGVASVSQLRAELPEQRRATSQAH